MGKIRELRGWMVGHRSYYCSLTETEAHLRAGCEPPREDRTQSTSAGALLPKAAQGETWES